MNKSIIVIEGSSKSLTIEIKPQKISSCKNDAVELFKVLTDVIPGKTYKFILELIKLYDDPNVYTTNDAINKFKEVHNL